MFAQVCLIAVALVAGDITLANGIRVVELPAEPSSFEIVAGYQVENSPIAAVLSTFLIATGSARRMAVAAYGAGGQIEFISDHVWQRDRSGVLSNPGTITITHVQDVARIYFQ